jgi:hypothetical protein
MSPDPTGGNLLNPQTLNKYSYTLNNPLIYTDPTGLDCVYINNDSGTFENFNSGDCDNSTAANANSGYYIDATVNSIAFNSQNQVVGYGTTTGSEGTFDSFAGSTSAGVAAAFLNPYTEAVSGSEQTVTVNGSSPASPDLTSLSLSSSIPAGGFPPIMNQIGPLPPPRKMTPGEIRMWCEVATAMSAGGTVPGAVPPSPTEDTPDQNMLVPSENARFPGETKETVTRPMAPNTGTGNNAGNAAAMGGTYAGCVGAVTAANR